MTKLKKILAQDYGNGIDTEIVAYLVHQYKNGVSVIYSPELSGWSLCETKMKDYGLSQKEIDIVKGPHCWCLLSKHVKPYEK